MTHFLPCIKMINSQETIELVIHEVFMAFHIPSSMTELVIHEIFMVFHTPSSMTKACDSSPKFGNSCLDSSTLLINSLSSYYPKTNVFLKMH